MCGRFAFYSPHEAVTRLFGVAGVADIEPRWNIAPTQYIAAVRAATRGDVHRHAVIGGSFRPGRRSGPSVRA